MISFAVLLIIPACQMPNLNDLRKNPASLINSIKKSDSVTETDTNAPGTLGEIVSGSLPNDNLGSDFLTVMGFALKTDPAVSSSRLAADAKVDAIRTTMAQKQFQVSSTLYGGIEDVTDSTKGLALVLNASRLMYDGGKIDAEIDSIRLSADAAQFQLAVTANERALKLGEKWVDLEKYEKLQTKIKSRLDILEPLILQLEQVAEAGIGDVSKVTAAQRTVSTIRVAETNILEGLAQAQLNFVNEFGLLPANIKYDSLFVQKLVPEELTDEMLQGAPLLLSQYATYRANLAKISALKAKNRFNVGFEAKAQKPFGGSGYDSDESVGFVARKTLFNGGMLESEIKAAESSAEAKAAEIRATYRDAAGKIQTALQNIESMDKAILLARENAAITAEEIVYLRQQLIIGGSTLDSVLSAEARLYDAEAREIEYLAEKYKSQLLVVSALGLLSTALGL